VTVADAPWLVPSARRPEPSAVEAFSARHGTDSALTGRYRDLLPASPPGPGQQYAFEVDLDVCTGCKACVVACKSLNGLDLDESWRSVGLLRGVVEDKPLLQTVTTGCHHCLDPACLSGCPVDAYEKDPVTGIVAHLDDQCIGCRYCTLTCPYEVPRYNPSRGIVRKCDMCAGRLAEGEAPACAQACPNGAISITVVDQAEVRASTAAGALVPGAPASATTRPTTIYRTTRVDLADTRAADEHVLEPAHGHPPLVWMLVLTQLSVGTFVAQRLHPTDAGALLSVLAAVLAIGVSILHLGRPQYFWRSVIGLRHSWLSREAVAFGAFAGLAALSAAVPDGPLGAAVADAAAVTGLAGVGCSAMIYAVTGRALWRPARTMARFALTTATCGAAGLLVTGPTDAAALAWTVAGLGGLWLLWDLSHLVPRQGPLGRTSRLLRGPLLGLAQMRLLLGTVGVVLALVAASSPSRVVAALALLALVGGGVAERTLFFTAVTAPRMPGTFG
jgi:formate dehydrogenase iron-sulfur subunit